MPDAISLHRLDRENAGELLQARVFDHAVDPAQLQAFIADPGHELVFATRSGQVVGMASGSVLLHPDKPPMFLICEVGVLEDSRRGGVATRLVERLQEIARGRGCHGIWLATEADNVAAGALYRSLSGRSTEGIVVYDWDGVMDDEH